MRGLAIAGVVGSAALVGVGVMVGRDRLAAAQANIRRYSMPGPRSYDLVAHLLFDDRYRAIATAIAAEVPAGSSSSTSGCGPGEILARLASIAPAIETTGARRRPGHDRARRAQGRSGASPAAPRRRPTFVVADAASLPFADASLRRRRQLVLGPPLAGPPCRARRGMRVLRPGGRAIVWDIAPAPPDRG